LAAAKKNQRNWIAFFFLMILFPVHLWNYILYINIASTFLVRRSFWFLILLFLLSANCLLVMQHHFCCAGRCFSFAKLHSIWRFLFLCICFLYFLHHKAQSYETCKERQPATGITMYHITMYQF
jgi:hypothetical protein